MSSPMDKNNVTKLSITDEYSGDFDSRVSKVLSMTSQSDVVPKEIFPIVFLALWLTIVGFVLTHIIFSVYLSFFYTPVEEYRKYIDSKIPKQNQESYNYIQEKEILSSIMTKTMDSYKTKFARLGYGNLIISSILLLAHLFGIYSFYSQSSSLITLYLAFMWMSAFIFILLVCRMLTFEEDVTDGFFEDFFFKISNKIFICVLCKAGKGKNMSFFHYIDQSVLFQACQLNCCADDQYWHNYQLTNVTSVNISHRCCDQLIRNNISVVIHVKSQKFCKIQYPANIFCDAKEKDNRKYSCSKGSIYSKNNLDLTVFVDNLNIFYSMMVFLLSIGASFLILFIYPKI